MRLLLDEIGKYYYIFPQIHLGNIMNPKVRWSYKWHDWKDAFFRSNELSVDYLVCSKNNVKPLLAIELDDISHATKKRRLRDAGVERMFRDAELPLLRIKESENLPKEEILRRVYNEIHSIKTV